MKTGPLVLLALFIACQTESRAPRVEQRGDVLYESDLWSYPGDFPFDFSASCAFRNNLPGCSDFPEPRIEDVAVDGSRLVVLVANANQRDLLVSNDLGVTVERFSVGTLLGNGGARLYSVLGRILVFAEFNDETTHTSQQARVFELNTERGTLISLNQTAMSSAFVHNAGGVLSSVNFDNIAPPQRLAISVFESEGNLLSRDSLDCNVAGCEYAYPGEPFLSNDGDTFTRVIPGGPDHTDCLMTVRRSTKTVESTCDVTLQTNAPTIPLGALRLSHGYPHVRFFALEPIAPATTPTILRVSPLGELHQTTLDRETCFGSPGNFSVCPTIAAIHPLSDDELLIITIRDELEEPERAHQVFEVFRSIRPFEPFLSVH